MEQFELINPCKYSFQDLLTASPEKTLTLTELYSLSQEDRNRKVKELCQKAEWFYKDTVGQDGVIYTAFSPCGIKYSTKQIVCYMCEGEGVIYFCPKCNGSRKID